MFFRNYMGEDLDSLNLKELQNLEHQLDSALKHIRSRKVKFVQSNTMTNVIFSLIRDTISMFIELKIS